MPRYAVILNAVAFSNRVTVTGYRVHALLRTVISLMYNEGLFTVKRIVSNQSMRTQKSNPYMYIIRTCSPVPGVRVLYSTALGSATEPQAQGAGVLSGVPPLKPLCITHCQR